MQSELETSRIEDGEERERIENAKKAIRVSYGFDPPSEELKQELAKELNISYDTSLPADPSKGERESLYRRSLSLSLSDCELPVPPQGLESPSTYSQASSIPTYEIMEDEIDLNDPL